MAQLTREAAVRDARSLVEQIAGDPAALQRPFVCVGYCMGARLALHAAASMPDDVAAAAGIHPSALFTDQPDSPHRGLPTVAAELYLAYAEQDRTATAENVDRFRAELERHGVEGVVERLPDTAHGFAMADLPVYDRDATEHAVELTLDLWRRNIPH